MSQALKEATGRAPCMRPLLFSGCNTLSGLEQQNRDLAQVEVDEVLCLVCDVGPKVAPNDGMPCGIVLFVELLLDEGGDIFLDVVLLKGLCCAIDRILLHILGHVCVLDDGLAVSHSGHHWVSLPASENLQAYNSLEL